MSLSIDKIEAIVSLRKQGKTKKEIKTLTGCAVPTIEKYLLENGFSKESLSDNWKTDVLKRLVQFSVKSSGYKKFFFIQIKGLEKLYKLFPNREFWQKVSFVEKFTSINYLLYEPMSSILRDKYNQFKYRVPEKKGYIEGEKAGNDRIIEKQAKTLKQFFDS
jgi:hypothetical protein